MRARGPRKVLMAVVAISLLALAVAGAVAVPSNVTRKSPPVAAVPTMVPVPSKGYLSVTQNLDNLQASFAGCSAACPNLRKKQRSAAALAISMVLYVDCEGDVQSAAKAIVAAAASGDTEAFSAGFATATSRLSPYPEQFADTLTNTFTVANSAGKTMGVVAGMADAIGKMSGSQLSDVLTKVVVSLNSLATKATCHLAGEVAGDFFFALLKLNGLASKTFLDISRSSGTNCWGRRLARLAKSELAAMPPVMSPCTRAMQEASAVSVTMVTASTCKTAPQQLSAAAQALVTASVSNGCAFASAITSATLWAITKAKVGKHEVALTAALASAYGEIVYDSANRTGLSSSQNFLKAVLRAVARSIDTSGCARTKTFVQGLFNSLVQVAPANAAYIKQCFLGVKQIKQCKCIT